MVESFKRYYHNSFLDSQRQEAYNLFLGHYIYAQGQPMLWDLVTDYYLHHADPREWSTRLRRSYIDWYTPEFLHEPTMPPVAMEEHSRFRGNDTRDTCDDYWLEYYRPTAVSSFSKIFSLRMNSTSKPDPEGVIDPSPFRVRSGGLNESPSRKRRRRRSSRMGFGGNGGSVAESCGYKSDDASSQTSRSILSEKLVTPSSSHWSLLPPMEIKTLIDDRLSAMPGGDGLKGKMTTAIPTAPVLATADDLDPSLVTEKPIPAQRTLEQFVLDSLNPSVTRTEAEEYQRYLDHPLHLPLVVSTSSNMGLPPTTKPASMEEISSQPPNLSIEYARYLNLANLVTVTTGIITTPRTLPLLPTPTKAAAPLLPSRTSALENLNDHIENGRGNANTNVASTMVAAAAVPQSDHDEAMTADLGSSMMMTEDDLADYVDYLTVSENPLTVTEADAPKKRYKAYRQWLKGRSLFKQQRVEP